MTLYKETTQISVDDLAMTRKNHPLYAPDYDQPCIIINGLDYDSFGSTTIWTKFKFGPKAGFGPKTNSDQRQSQTENLKSVQVIPVIKLIN